MSKGVIVGLSIALVGAVISLGAQLYKIANKPTTIKGYHPEAMRLLINHCSKVELDKPLHVPGSDKEHILYRCDTTDGPGAYFVL